MICKNVAMMCKTLTFVFNIITSRIEITNNNEMVPLPVFELSGLGGLNPLALCPTPHQIA